MLCDVDWNRVAQDGHKLRALMNTRTKPWADELQGICNLFEELLLT